MAHVVVFYNLVAKGVGQGCRGCVVKLAATVGLDVACSGFVGLVHGQTAGLYGKCEGHPACLTIFSMSSNDGSGVHGLTQNGRSGVMGSVSA